MARTFEELVELFNDRPLEGMRNLTQEGFVGNSPDDIATFLRTHKSLRKKNIGEFLTETSPENLQAFVEQFDFANVDFVEALRTFLYSFILPGEAQKIDRLMESFANAYYTQNQNSPTNHFLDADSCYILAFSIIMLNTDATAPMIKRKMTSSEFVRGLIGINAGGDLPQDFTEHVYDTVHREPFEIRDTPLGESKKRGYLQKKGFLFLKKKLWFMVTTDSRLYYFKDEIDGYNHKPMGYFDLENVNVETSCSGNNFIIEISPTEGQTSLKEFQMDNNNEPQEETCPKLVLTASSMDEMEDWCESLVGNYKATRASNNFKSARK